MTPMRLFRHHFAMSVFAGILTWGHPPWAPAATYLPDLKGEVLDAESRAPIPGAYVAVLYRGDDPGSIIAHGGRRELCLRVALGRTDRAGRFEIPWVRIKKDYIRRTYTISVFKSGYLSRDEEVAQKKDNYFAHLKSLPKTLDEYRSYSIWSTNKIDNSDNHVELLWRDPGSDGRVERTHRPEQAIIGEVGPFGEKRTVKLDAIDETETLRVAYLRSRAEPFFSCSAYPDVDGFPPLPHLLYPLYKAMYEEARSLAKTDKDHDNVRRLCHLAISDKARRGGERETPATCDINNVPEDWKRWDDAFQTGKGNEFVHPSQK